MRSGPLYSVGQLPCAFIGPLRMRTQRIGGKFLSESTHPTSQIFVVRCDCDSSCFHIPSLTKRLGAAALHLCVNVTSDATLTTHPPVSS